MRPARAGTRRFAGPGLRRARVVAAAALLPVFGALGGSPASGEPIPEEAWREPPRELRPVARWWWPGGSVDAAGLERHLRQIRAAGFGAVELQPLLLGLGDDDLAADPRLRSVGLPGFRRSVAIAAAAAARLGLEFDLTLGSGWPGGLPTPKRNAERQLVMATRDVRGPARFEGALPGPPDQSYRRAVEWVLDVLGPPDPEAEVVAVLAARLAAKRGGLPVLEEVRVLDTPGPDRNLAWDVPDGEWRLFVFYENATGHFVMGGAFPGAEADARVVDHLSRRGADALLEGYAAPLLDALPPGAVRELFVDSFELVGELPFTGDLLATFEAQAGYDPTPHLPLLFRKGGEAKYAEAMAWFRRAGGPLYRAREVEAGRRAREDYERARAFLFAERFVAPIARWARRRGLALRLQAHGGHADYLDTYALADVPESEGLFAGGSFDFLKLASSAAHVAGRHWASSESFITLRPFGTRLSLDEMRLLAGRAYSAGINRLAFHGVPYPYTRADGEVWYPFSGGFGRILAGPFPMSSHLDAAFLARLPEFNRFLGRLSVAMGQGEPVAEVAWLRSDADHPDSVGLQLGRVEPHAGESAASRALRARGLGYDRVSRRMLAAARRLPDGFQVGAQHYRALLLDPLAVAEPSLAERIVELAQAGVPVLALGPLPRRAPGLRDARLRDERVRAATRRLADLVVRVPNPGRLEDLLARHVGSGLVEPLPGASLAVSLARRRTRAGDVLLVFNESWSPRRTRLRLTRAGGSLERWDPRSGTRALLRARVSAGDEMALALDAAEALVLTLGAPAAPASAARQAPARSDSNGMAWRWR